MGFINSLRSNCRNSYLATLIFYTVGADVWSIVPPWPLPRASLVSGTPKTPWNPCCKRFNLAPAHWNAMTSLGRPHRGPKFTGQNDKITLVHNVCMHVDKYMCIKRCVYIYIYMYVLCIYIYIDIYLTDHVCRNASSFASRPGPPGDLLFLGATEGQWSEGPAFVPSGAIWWGFSVAVGYQL